MMEGITTDLKKALPAGSSHCPNHGHDRGEDAGLALPGEHALSTQAHSHQAVHVEVCQKLMSTAKPGLIKQHVSKLLAERQQMCYADFTMTQFDSDPFLQEHVTSLALSDTEFYTNNGKRAVELSGASVHIHVYQLHTEGGAQEELEEDDEDVSAATHWLLPSADFHGLWDNLIFDSTVKPELLQYAATTLLFSDKQVDSNIISWNRVVLLHGPPGTGKTSLCKALAQKLCIHLSDRYSYGQLIEINSHSLFSKWFSESGKLVMKMFQKIQELVDDPEALVFVLIDEVESLTAARKASMSGTEPSDAIRVVNALLTQLDQIKKNPNVLILTTSNITGAIDLAFVDRADIKQYIGLPSPPAIYKIYHSCLNELTRCGIISPADQLLDLPMLSLMHSTESNGTRLSLKLKHIAIQSEGLSGRTLRKLPFIAHAVFVQSPTISLDQFLDALLKAVERQFQEREELTR